VTTLAQFDALVEEATKQLSKLQDSLKTTFHQVFKLTLSSLNGQQQQLTFVELAASDSKQEPWVS
jgi:hypothetical protein